MTNTKTNFQMVMDLMWACRPDVDVFRIDLYGVKGEPLGYNDCYAKMWEHEEDPDIYGSGIIVSLSIQDVEAGDKIFTKMCVMSFTG